MVARRIYHWKHGWIPLDHYAALENANGRSSTTRLAAGDTAAITSLLRPESEQLDDLRKGGKYDDPALFSDMDEVDGVQFRTYKSASFDPGDGRQKPHKFTKAQKQEIAATLNELRAKFPKALPITIVGTVDHDNMGVTEWSGDRITLSSIMFSPAGIEMARSSFGPTGSVVAGTRTNADFRRAVIAHEFGHALEVQQEASRLAGMAVANERILPKDLGVQVPGPVAPTPRWMVDSLNNRTAYGNDNQFEWFAEAFADGYLHGGSASSSGKRVLRMVSELYGGEALS